METNVLIAKTQLGKVCPGLPACSRDTSATNTRLLLLSHTQLPSVHNLYCSLAVLQVKKTTFNSSPADRAYGAVQPPDAEGARAVISTWKPHVPNPHAKPGPDFLAMNKAAADTGLVSSGQFKAFRWAEAACGLGEPAAGRGACCMEYATLLLLPLCARRYVHPMHLRTGVEGVSKHTPALPSDKDHTFTYGKPAAYRCVRAGVTAPAHASSWAQAACSMCSPSTGSSQQPAVRVGYSLK